MSKPSVSSLERAWECPASCAIRTQVHSTGGGAIRGDRIHDFAEHVLSGYETRDAALAKVPVEYRQTCADIDWSALVGDIVTASIRCEVAYAVDAATGNVRELGVGLKRAYPESSETEIVGTNDVEGLLLSGVPVVQDIKTGQPVTAAKDNWQIRYHAYVQYIRTGAPVVVGRLAYIAEDGNVTLDSHAFDAFELDDFPSQLRGVFARIAKAVEEVRSGLVVVSEGPHCRYCGCFASCPAKVGMIRSLAPALGEMAAEAGEFAELTPQRVGEIWMRFKELQPMVKRIDEALKEYVRSRAPGEVVQPDGKVLTDVVSGKDYVKGDRALALARKCGATDKELAECVERTEWRSMRAVAPKKTKAKKGEEAV